MAVDTSSKSRTAKGVSPGVGLPEGRTSEEPSGAARGPSLPIDGSSTVRDLLAAGLEALDLLNIGLVVCSATGHMLVSNRTAEQILQAHDGLVLDSEGRLAATLDEAGALKALIRTVAESAHAQQGSKDTAFAVERESGKRPLTLFVRAVTAKSDARGPNEAAVLGMIVDCAQPVEATKAELRQLYGFTGTEARLANHLMEGLALEDCCQAMGIRRTTARMHLRNIFAKTGVRRQGELVSLLLKSIGLGPRPK